MKVPLHEVVIVVECHGAGIVTLKIGLCVYSVCESARGLGVIIGGIVGETSSLQGRLFASQLGIFALEVFDLSFQGFFAAECLVEGLLELAFRGLGDHFRLRGAALFVLVYGAAVEVVDHF